MYIYVCVYIYVLFPARGILKKRKMSQMFNSNHYAKTQKKSVKKRSFMKLIRKKKKKEKKKPFHGLRSFNSFPVQ